MKTTLLVLGGGPLQVPLVKALKKAGFRILLADRDAGAPCARYSGLHIRASKYSSREITAKLRMFPDEKIRFIISASVSRSQITALRLSEKLLPEHYSADFKKALLGKDYLKKKLKAAGVPHPAPCKKGRAGVWALKKKSGWGAKYVRVVNVLPPSLSGWIAEEYVPGREFSLRGYIGSGRAEIYAKSERL